MQVYAREFEVHFHENHKGYLRNACDSSKSLQISDNGYCWRLIKNSNVITPLPEFEVAFVHALDHIGIRTKLQDPLTYDVVQLADTSTP